jgi:hypothetical protein
VSTVTATRWPAATHILIIFHQWRHVQLILWEITAASFLVLSLLYFVATEHLAAKGPRGPLAAHLMYSYRVLVRTYYSSSSNRARHANTIHVAVSVASALHMPVLSLHIASHNHHPQPFNNPHSFCQPVVPAKDAASESSMCEFRLPYIHYCHLCSTVARALLACSSNVIAALCTACLPNVPPNFTPNFTLVTPTFQ